MITPENLDRLCTLYDKILHDRTSEAQQYELLKKFRDAALSPNKPYLHGLSLTWSHSFIRLDAILSIRHIKGRTLYPIASAMNTHTPIHNALRLQLLGHWSDFAPLKDSPDEFKHPLRAYALLLLLNVVNNIRADKQGNYKPVFMAELKTSIDLLYNEYMGSDEDSIMSRMRDYKGDPLKAPARRLPMKAKIQHEAVEYFLTYGERPTYSQLAEYINDKAFFKDAEDKRKHAATAKRIKDTVCAYKLNKGLFTIRPYGAGVCVAVEDAERVCVQTCEGVCVVDGEQKSVLQQESVLNAEERELNAEEKSVLHAEEKSVLHAEERELSTEERVLQRENVPIAEESGPAEESAPQPPTAATAATGHLRPIHWNAPKAPTRQDYERMRAEVDAWYNNPDPDPLF